MHLLAERGLVHDVAAQVLTGNALVSAFYKVRIAKKY